MKPLKGYTPLFSLSLPGNHTNVFCGYSLNTARKIGHMYNCIPDNTGLLLSL